MDDNQSGSFSPTNGGYAAGARDGQDNRAATPDRAQSDQAITDAPNQVGATMLVTSRIGIHFTIAAIGSLICACAAIFLGQSQAFSALMWMTTVAVCCLTGLVSMRSVKPLRSIEAELAVRAGDPPRWYGARPIIGDDPITAGWNELLAELEDNRSDRGHRAPATLDQKAITMARAMRGLPVAWVVTDKNGVVHNLSAPACGLFNLPDDQDHTGTNLLDLLQLDEQDEGHERIRARLLGNLQLVRQRHALQRGAAQTYLRIARARLGGRSGDGEGFAWVIDDSTQQELATQSRDQFLMTATHELRTPLTNLQAYAETLAEEDELEVESQKEFCNIIVSEANRLGRLIDQLLTVGQLEAGSLMVHRRELEVLPMIEYSAEHLRAQAEKKSISLQTDLAPKLPTVHGDREKLQAALANLVGNAVKYTQNGGEVVVRCSSDDQWVRIDVQDNGPGIPENEHEKVFEKFFRSSGNDVADERGNGLGLAFTREVARLHGGDVDLHSARGEGSVFTMRLPIGGQSRSGI